MKKFRKLFLMITVICLCFSLAVINVSAVQTDSATSTNVVTTDNTTDNYSYSEDETDDEIDYSWSNNTEGNSELIAHQQVIMENGEYEFIAVTTRDEDVFYVIIDKTKKEDNVYFLNEVDTTDIQKLVNSKSEDDPNSFDTSFVDNSDSSDKEDDTSAAEDSSAEKPQSSNDDNSFTIILIIGILVLAGGGFALYKFKLKGKSSKVNDDDFDFDDEDEINEDEENN